MSVSEPFQTSKPKTAGGKAWTRFVFKVECLIQVSDWLLPAFQLNGLVKIGWPRPQLSLFANNACTDRLVELFADHEIPISKIYY